MLRLMCGVGQGILTRALVELRTGRMGCMSLSCSRWRWFRQAIILDDVPILVPPTGLKVKVQKGDFIRIVFISFHIIVARLRCGVLGRCATYTKLCPVRIHQ